MANHHYVPRFYFRNFSLDGRRICTYLPDRDSFALQAPIRGQCARNNFHCHDEVENQIATIEGRHRTAIAEFIRYADDPSRGPSGEAVFNAYSCALLQHSRTVLEARKNSAANSALVLRMFREHVAADHSFDQRVGAIDAIDRGEVTVSQDIRAAALQSIGFALESTTLILDLEWCLLRNCTDYDFIFSDSPSIFCNTYYRHITHRGVLGLTTPGLQIFMPLNSNLTLMLFDAAQYDGPALDRYVIDILERQDVSRLNSLQILHHDAGVYFARHEQAEYVRELWHAHRRKSAKPSVVLETRDGWLLNGRPTEGLIAWFTYDGNASIDLSFVRCQPCDPRQFQFRRRDESLYSEYRKLMEECRPDNSDME